MAAQKRRPDGIATRICHHQAATQYESALMTSPPARVPSANHTFAFIEFLKK
jgi:hypothetical protein